jgi:hypothetical protein
MLDVGSDAPRFCGPDSLSFTGLSNITAVLQGNISIAPKASANWFALKQPPAQIWTNSLTSSKNGASIHITPQDSGFFLFTDEGNLIRAQLSPAGYREISRSHLIDPTWPFAERKFVYAPPAFADRHVFARNEGEWFASLEVNRTDRRSRRADHSMFPVSRGRWVVWSDEFHPGTRRSWHGL